MDDNETRAVEAFLQWLVYMSPYWVVDGEDNTISAETVIDAYRDFRESDAGEAVQP